MPGYIQKVLHKLQHPLLKHPEQALYQAETKIWHQGLIYRSSRQDKTIYTSRNEYTPTKSWLLTVLRTITGYENDFCIKYVSIGAGKWDGRNGLCDVKIIELLCNQYVCHGQVQSKRHDYSYSQLRALSLKYEGTYQGWGQHIFNKKSKTRTINDE